MTVNGKVVVGEREGWGGGGKAIDLKKIDNKPVSD